MTKYMALIKLSILAIWIETTPQPTRTQAEAHALQILEDAKTKVVKD